MTIRAIPTYAYTEGTEQVLPQAIVDARPAYARADWSVQPKVVTAYSTQSSYDVFKGFQQSVSNARRPQRQVSIDCIGTGDSYHDLIQFAQRMSPRAIPISVSFDPARHGTGIYTQVPLEPDRVCIGRLAALDTVTDDFRYRRFYVGGRAFYTAPNMAPITLGGERVPALLVEITGKTDSSVTVNSPVQIQVGGHLTPAIDCEPTASASLRLLTGRQARCSVSAVEAAGTSALPPTVARGAVPAGFQTFRSRQELIDRLVYVMPHNWENELSITLARPGEGLWLSGDTPVVQMSLAPRLASRADFWGLLQTFDSCRGASEVFWAVTPAVVATGGTRVTASTVQLSAQGNHNELLRFARALAFVYSDGSVVLAEVASISSSYLVTLFQNIPAGTISCVKLALLSRFGSDDLAESWLTLNQVDLSFSLREEFALIDLEMIAP